MAKQKINIEGTKITIKKINGTDYISLTDIATNFGTPSDVIRNWMRKPDTLGYLHEWELLYNNGYDETGFNEIASDLVKRSSSFNISPKLWIEKTNSIGLTSSMGRYAATYSHPDIAVNFCYWLSPKFQIYFIKEFRRLKEKEQSDWLQEAKFYIDRAENHSLEANRFNKDLQKLINDKSKDK